MTRLINADELEKRLQDFKEWEDCDGNTLHTMSERQRISKCIEISREQPIAYDVDKVVEKLEEAIADTTDTETGLGARWAYTGAIEIVKQGGVSDDVCEWKYPKEIMDNTEFEVSCNSRPLKRGIVPNNFSFYDFKYCPYCGKKIKVVE